MSSIKIKPETTSDAPTSDPSPPVPTHRRRRRRTTRQKIAPEVRQEIVRLHTFYGTRAIARRALVSRKVVRRVLEEEGCLSRPPDTSLGKIIPFLDPIQERVLQGLTISRILREIRELGYQGHRTILAQHIRDLRIQQALTLPQKKDVKRRFETDPGKEMQVDWSPFRVIIASQLVLVHVLTVILCYSRKLFVGYFRDEREHTLLEGLARAFEYFQGCALQLVLDNMATAVLGRIGPDKKPIWHPRFHDLVTHYGIKSIACRPRHPNRKGKIEKPYQLVYNDFLKEAKFRSWEHLMAEGAQWLDHKLDASNLRVHGTTGEVPNEAYLAERDLLIRLPHERFPVYEDAVRSVDDDSTLSIYQRKYTVPSPLANRSVPVRLFAHHFEVLDREGRVAFSRAYAGPDEKRMLLIEPTHYAGLPRRPLETTTRQRLDESFLMRFPMLAPLVDGLKLRMKTLAPIHLRALLRLASKYGQDAFVAAAMRAQEFRRFDAAAVQRILERECPEPPDDPILPLTGAGVAAAAVGEVDAGELDSFSHLDKDPPSSTPSDAPLSPPNSDDPEEDPHGS
jgi:transposase